MVRHKVILCCLFCLTLFGQNLFAFEDEEEEECFEDFETFSGWNDTGDDDDNTDLELHGRVKRSFGGKEQINYTLVNTNVQGVPGFVPLISGATMDMVFHITGYWVLGKVQQVDVHTRRVSL